MYFKYYRGQFMEFNKLNNLTCVCLWSFYHRYIDFSTLKTKIEDT